MVGCLEKKKLFLAQNVKVPIGINKGFIKETRIKKRKGELGYLIGSIDGEGAIMIKLQGGKNLGKMRMIRISK